MGIGEKGNKNAYKWAKNRTLRLYGELSENWWDGIMKKRFRCSTNEILLLNKEGILEWKPDFIQITVKQSLLIN